MTNPQQSLADRLEKARDAVLSTDVKTIEKWRANRTEFLHLCLENATAILTALRASTSAREEIPKSSPLPWRFVPDKYPEYGSIMSANGKSVFEHVRRDHAEPIINAINSRTAVPASLIEEHARVAEGVLFSDGPYRCEVADAKTGQIAKDWHPDSNYGHGRSDAAKAIRATGGGNDKSL
jgi:hypothetical protein